MDTQKRIAELEQIISKKQAQMSKSKFSSWYNRAAEVQELCTLKARQNSSPAASRNNGQSWRNDPVTSRQRDCLFHLGIEIEPGLTKGRASDLIEAAKRSDDILGSIGGFRRDGSN